MSIPGSGKSYPYWPASYADSGGGGGGGGGSTDLASPIGDTSFSASARNPFGYLNCDGSVVSQTAYPDLFLSLGHTYDGVAGVNANSNCRQYASGSDFVIPNFNVNPGNSVSRFPTGAFLSVFNTSNAEIPDVVGGASQVVLNASNVPQHKHTYFQAGSQSINPVGGSQAAGNQFNVGAYTGSSIYDSNTNLVVNGDPAPFSITPSFMLFNSIVRSDNPYTSARVGYTTFTSANNKFYLSLLANAANLPDPPISDFNVFAITLPIGNFTRQQVLNNIASSIKTSVNSYSGTTGVTIASCDISGNAITPTGMYVMSLKIVVTPPGSDIAYGNFCFLTSSAYAGANYITGDIPADVLDRTADTLGFLTRSYNPGVTSFIQNQYNFNSYGGELSYIAPPKAMKINWNGSIQNNDFNASLFAPINTYT